MQTPPSSDIHNIVIYLKSSKFVSCDKFASVFRNDGVWLANTGQKRAMTSVEKLLM